jgi:hypothetical protein
MARQISKRPSSTGTRNTTRGPRLMSGGSVDVTQAIPRRPAASAPVAREETIEDRLIAKAEAADRRDYTGQRSLGDMSREELHALLSGKG